jgi:hypothetical protein
MPWHPHSVLFFLYWNHNIPRRHGAVIKYSLRRDGGYWEALGDVNQISVEIGNQILGEFW